YSNPISSQSPIHIKKLHPFPTRRSSDLQAVFAGFIAFDQFRFNRTGIGQLEQGFIDVAVEGFVDALAGPGGVVKVLRLIERADADRKSTRLNSSHVKISYAVFCLRRKNI